MARRLAKAYALEFLQDVLVEEHLRRKELRKQVEVR